jgi:hypothetical protein
MFYWQSLAEEGCGDCNQDSTSHEEILTNEKDRGVKHSVFFCLGGRITRLLGDWGF